MEAPRFQILSLDGGGIRGMYSAAVLAKLEEKLDVKVVDHFDLIVGTSTGGIIALGLALGMRPREILRFYAQDGLTIFSNRLGWRKTLHVLRRKYPSSRLEKALRAPSAFGDKRLSDCSKRVVVPAYDLAHDRVRIFKTPHHERLTTDWRLPAWQVALATSAAPTFFPSCRAVPDSRLIDGGVWANNPTVIGIVEATSMLSAPLEGVHVLSLGTTSDRAKRPRNLDRGGVLPWIRKGHLIDVLMRGQSEGTNGLAQHLIGRDRLLRVDPIVPASLPLDRIESEAFLGLAEHVALTEGPEIEARFFQHVASAYSPLHPKEPFADRPIVDDGGHRSRPETAKPSAG